MKYTISNENKWTTLAAYATNGLFYPYEANYYVRNNLGWLFNYKAKGLYQEAKQPKILNCVEITVEPDYKHISPETWNDITSDFNNLDEKQMQDEIINALQESFRDYYFGDVQKQEQEMHFKIKKSLSDMYYDGYTDGYHKKEPEFYDVQGRYDFVLDAVMEYIRAFINNQK